jgi:hypothetical protein
MIVNLILFFIFAFEILALCYIVMKQRKTIKILMDIIKIYQNLLTLSDTIIFKIDSDIKDLIKPNKIKSNLTYNIDDILIEISEKGLENISEDKIEFLKKLKNK